MGTIALLGAGAGAPAAAAAAITSSQVYTDVVDRTTYTSNNLNALGSSGRPVVAVFSRGTSNRTISSVAVGATGLTQLIKVDNDTLNCIGLYIGDEGLQGEVTYTLSAAHLRAVIIMYRVTNIASTTPTDTQTQTVDNTSTNVAVSAGGVIIGAALTASSSSTNTWTGLTEDFDTQTAEALVASTASLASASAQTVGCSVDISTATFWRAIYASLR